MKKIIRLSMVSVLALASLQASEVSKDADNLEDMFANGKVSGQIREFSISRHVRDNRPGKKEYTRDANAIGGYLKFETADYKGLSFGTAFYTTNGFALADPKSDNTAVDPSLLGKNNESYSMLGEAYVEYKVDKTAIKIGRQKFSTAMMGADDARMLPNLFEAYTLTNKDINGLDIQVAHVNKFAQGTFGRVYGSGGLLGSTAGYSAWDASNQVGEFKNMGEYAVGKKTDGVTNVQLKYKIENFNIKISNDYAWDLYNTLYADAGISWKCLLSDSVKSFFKAQVIKQNSTGDEYMKNIDTIAGTSATSDGDIDSLYWAVKAGAKVNGLTAYVSYSETTDNDASDVTNGNAYANAIITQFGGMPAYTQGMVTRHQFLAGTKATKVAASYSFKEHGLNLSAAAYYASFDMDENSGYGKERTAYEPGFDIKYYPSMVKNLQLRFRGNFPRNFYEDSTGSVGWNEYRFIANYNF